MNINQSIPIALNCPLLHLPDIEQAIAILDRINAADDGERLYLPPDDALLIGMILDQLLTDRGDPIDWASAE
jgi:hypothetical protein